MFRLSFEVCAQHFSYDAASGVLRWKKPTSRRIKPNSIAGSLNNKGYRRVSFLGGTISAHRLAWLLHYEEWPVGDLDHINRVRDDNRIENLRIVTPSENAKNREHRKPGQMRHGGTGVTKQGRRWQVQVHCPRRRKAIYGGLFLSRSDALRRAEEMRRGFDL